MRTSELVECSQTIRLPSASSVMPLPLLLGLRDLRDAALLVPAPARVGRHVGEEQELPCGFQIGPSVKVKPVPSCSTSTFSSTSSASFSDSRSTLTLASLYVGKEESRN